MSKSNFIEIITATFAAGESRLFALSGQYFELIDAAFSVDVALSDVYGAQRGLMRNAEASFNLKNTDFAVVQITSASAQTIRFAYGSGEAGTRRASGAVSIVGTVPILDRPELPSSNWKDGSVIAVNTPLTVFSPASNTNGVLIFSAEASDTIAVNGTAVFIAKNSAPASITDGEVITQSHSVSPNQLGIKLQHPTRIAVGLGLYYIATVAGNPQALRNVRYTPL